MNGCGELTGMAWVEESGIATGPYMITGTGSVGLVHDALLMWSHQYSHLPPQLIMRLELLLGQTLF